MSVLLRNSQEPIKSACVICSFARSVWEEDEINVPITLRVFRDKTRSVGHVGGCFIVTAPRRGVGC